MAGRLHGTLFEIGVFLRDWRREWRGEPPSKYPGLHRGIGYRDRPGSFRAGVYMSRYVKLLAMPFDFWVRLAGFVRWQRQIGWFV